MTGRIRANSFNLEEALEKRHGLKKIWTRTQLFRYDLMHKGCEYLSSSTSGGGSGFALSSLVKIVNDKI